MRAVHAFLAVLALVAGCATTGPATQPTTAVPALPVPAGDYPVQLDGRLDADLSRWLWVVKWLLAIPHFVVLIFLSIGAFFAVIVAWFAILFTGHYPRGLFDYVVGVGRWWLRVDAYAFLLVTDRYPPFSLK